jgi:hypothetical protein
MHPAAVTTAVTTATTTVTSGSRSKRCEAQGSGGNNCESDFTKHCGSHLCEARHSLCLYADGTQADEIRFNIFFLNRRSLRRDPRALKAILKQKLERDDDRRKVIPL